MPLLFPLRRHILSLTLHKNSHSPNQSTLFPDHSGWDKTLIAGLIQLKTLNEKWGKIFHFPVV